MTRVRARRKASLPTAAKLQQLVAAAVRSELEQMNAVASPPIACEGRAFSDSPRAIDGGSSEEEPMYRKIYGPYDKDGRFTVHLFLLDGRKQYKRFATEEEAFDFMQANRRRTVSSPVTIREAVASYIAGRSDLRESSRVTLRYRLEAFMKGSEQLYVQLFPAHTAWKRVAAESSVDTLYGIRSAAQGFFAWCVRQGYLKRAPLADVQIVGKKRRGKPQLRIDEARRFLVRALEEAERGGRDQGQQGVAALAAAVALLLGLRAQEVVGRQVRDLDDNGTVFWVPTSKTEAGVRRVEVPEVLRSFLLRLTEGRASDAPLFSELTKDGLRYWTETLCKRAGLPRVTPHGLRGTNATASMRANANPHMVAAALGHASIGVTLRHYADPSAVAEAKQRAAVAALLPAKNSAKTFGGEPPEQESPTDGPGQLTATAT
jgi:integrase